MKKIKIPVRMRNEILRVTPPLPTDSGIKCKKAPPRREPTERETKKRITLFRVSFLRKIKNIPRSEISETIRTLRRVNIIGPMRLNKYFCFYIFLSIII